MLRPSRRSPYDASRSQRSTTSGTASRKRRSAPISSTTCCVALGERRQPQVGHAEREQRVSRRRSSRPGVRRSAAARRASRRATAPRARRCGAWCPRRPSASSRSARPTPGARARRPAAARRGAATSPASKASTSVLALNHTSPASVGTRITVDQSRTCGCSISPVRVSPSSPSRSAIQPCAVATQAGSSHCSAAWEEGRPRRSWHLSIARPVRAARRRTPRRRAAARTGSPRAGRPADRRRRSAPRTPRPRRRPPAPPSSVRSTTRPVQVRSVGRVRSSGRVRGCQVRNR